MATAADAVVAAADAAAIKTPTWEFLAVRRRVPSADAVEKTRPFSRGLVVVNLDGPVRYKNSAKADPEQNPARRFESFVVLDSLIPWSHRSNIEALRPARVN